MDTVNPTRCRNCGDGIATHMANVEDATACGDWHPDTLPYVRTEDLARAIKAARQRGDDESADALELAAREINRLLMLGDPFGGPETERDRIIALHEPFENEGGDLMCRRCIVEPWPCPALRKVGVA